MPGEDCVRDVKALGNKPAKFAARVFVATEALEVWSGVVGHHVSKRLSVVAVSFTHQLWPSKDGAENRPRGLTIRSRQQTLKKLA